MNKKINILSLIMCFCFLIILCTGSYKYDVDEIAEALQTYQKENKIHHDDYKEFVEANVITPKKINEQRVDSNQEIEDIVIDGLYYVEFETYFKYIKFYEDSLVITLTTNMPPKKAVNWIDKQIENAPKGTYNISTEEITFTTVQEKKDGNTVKVDYKGHKKDGKLYLNSFSQATKNHTILIYKHFK